MNIKLKTITYCFLVLVSFKIYFLLELTKIRLSYLNSVAIVTDDFSLKNLIFESLERTSFLLILLYPLFLFLKLLGITCLLDTGFSLLNKSLPFTKLLLAVILAEYIYLFPDVVKIIWQQNWITNPYLPYVDYSPFHLLGLTHSPFLSKYLFNSFNYFEILYILFLSFSISVLDPSKFLYNCVAVLKTYGIFILCWSLCVGLFLENLLQP